MFQRLKAIQIFLCAASLFVIGCVGTSDPQYSNDTNQTNASDTFTSSDTSADTTSPETDDTSPQATSTLDLLYISGHLGTYRDCPEEAYDPDAAPVAGDIDGAACPDGVDCPGILNCTPAQVTLRIENIGDEGVTGINVTDVILLDADGAEHTFFPVVSQTSTTDTPFGGDLAAGDFVDVRVGFRGPYDLNALLPAADSDGFSAGAPVRVFIDAEGQAPGVLDTPTIYSQPEIDT